MSSLQPTKSAFGKHNPNVALSTGKTSPSWKPVLKKKGKPKKAAENKPVSKSILTASVLTVTKPSDDNISAHLNLKKLKISEEDQKDTFNATHSVVRSLFPGEKLDAGNDDFDIYEDFPSALPSSTKTTNQDTKITVFRPSRGSAFGTAHRKVGDTVYANDSWSKLDALGPIRSDRKWQAQINRYSNVSVVSNETLDFLKAVGTAEQEPAANCWTSAPVPLASMISEKERKGNKKTQLALRDYCEKIRVLLTEPDGPLKAADYLRDAVARFHCGDSPVAPDGQCYNLVIHAFAEHNDAQMAEEILDLMWTDFSNGNEVACPNAKIYTSVMHAWQRADAQDAALHCERLLEHMHDLYMTGKALDCKPDLFAYTACLHSWANSKRRDAPYRAEQLFITMKERFDATDDGARPDKVCYSNLMNVFVNSDLAKPRTEDFLWIMLDDFIAGNKEAEPTTRTFNTVLAMWGKVPEPQAPERAEFVLHRFLDLHKQGILSEGPDAYSFSLILKAWSNCSTRSDSALRALASFEWMIELYNKGTQGAIPDIIKFTTVISCLSHARLPSRAEYLLRKMVDMYRTGKVFAKPDKKCFNQVLSGWSKVAAVVQGAPHRAEGVLELMETLAKKDRGFLPDTWTYNTVIFCWKNGHDPARAEAILRRMPQAADKGSPKEVYRGPDKVSYEAVLQAWKVSPDPGKYDRIRALEDEIKELGLDKKGGTSKRALAALRRSAQ